MGKLFGALLAVGIAFVCLLLFYQGPRHEALQPIKQATLVVTPTIEQHLTVVCENAATALFGKDFSQYTTAVNSCFKSLKSSYDEMGWPGQDMYNRNLMEGYYAAQLAAETWVTLDTTYPYRIEDGRNAIITALQNEREAYDLH